MQMCVRRVDVTSVDWILELFRQSDICVCFSFYYVLLRSIEIGFISSILGNFFQIVKHLIIAMMYLMAVRYLNKK
jgi:hypothetical protein